MSFWPKKYHTARFINQGHEIKSNEIKKGQEGSRGKRGGYDRAIENRKHRSDFVQEQSSEQTKY